VAHARCRLVPYIHRPAISLPRWISFQIVRLEFAKRVKGDGPAGPLVLAFITFPEYLATAGSSFIKEKGCRGHIRIASNESIFSEAERRPPPGDEGAIMAVSSEPCPVCGKPGAQVIRCRPAECDYFCESCFTQFVGPPNDVPRKTNLIRSPVTIH